jgi:sugar lactone lactonase YvrE
MMTVTRWRSVDVVIDMHARLGEGPLWDHRKGILAWVDILAGLVHFTDPDTGVTQSIPAGTEVGALGLLSDDGYLLAVRSGFGTLEGTSTEITTVASILSGASSPARSPTTVPRPGRSTAVTSTAR